MSALALTATALFVSARAATVADHDAICKISAIIAFMLALVGVLLKLRVGLPPAAIEVIAPRST